MPSLWDAIAVYKKKQVIHIYHKDAYMLTPLNERLYRTVGKRGIGETLADTDDDVKYALQGFPKKNCGIIEWNQYDHRFWLEPNGFMTDAFPRYQVEKEEDPESPSLEYSDYPTRGQIIVFCSVLDLYIRTCFKGKKFSKYLEEGLDTDKEFSWNYPKAYKSIDDMYVVTQRYLDVVCRCLGIGRVVVRRGADDPRAERFPLNADDYLPQPVFSYGGHGLPEHEVVQEFGGSGCVSAWVSRGVLSAVLWDALVKPRQVRSGMVKEVEDSAVQSFFKALRNKANK